MSGISAAAWIAIGAAALSVVALAFAIAFFVQLRRVRRAQKVMLGNGTGDLVDFAVSLQARMDDLHRAVDEVAAGLSRIDKRVDGCLSHTSIVRYDAYEDAGGHQSASLAFPHPPPSPVVGARLPRRGALGRRRQRHPGTRLCADLRQGARPRPGLGRPVARGTAGGRPGNDLLAVPLAAIHACFSPAITPHAAVSSVALVTTVTRHRP